MWVGWLACSKDFLPKLVICFVFHGIQFDETFVYDYFLARNMLKIPWDVGDEEAITLLISKLLRLKLLHKECRKYIPSSQVSLIKRSGNGLC